MSSSDSSSSSPSMSPEPKNLTKKRKRSEKEYDEIEVNVAAPEPPSKKALRAAKKGKTVTPAVQHESDEEQGDPEAKSKRSEYGVWIGNLPWSAGKPELTKFMISNAEIAESDITRIHMPVPAKGKMDPGRQKLQAQNKGFAYVDFKTEEACKAVIALSEKLLTGRRLLIKNAKSFEGRPDTAVKTESKGKAASKRIFIGNLALETTEDDLKEQFAKCGDVLSVFMATFEDSGRCKGYAWITFKEIEPAEKAVRGYVEMGQDGDDDEQDDKKKAKKPRKWWVNRLHGRSLRIEFAEDATVRYQKRYGKPKDQDGEPVKEQSEPIVEVPAEKAPSKASKRERPKSGGHSHLRRDPRSIAPGVALAKAQRQSAAIVQGQGKKMTFD